ncbi:hypothetical protein C4233_06850 [Clostridioides difficile]|nr:hypothetical protein [Clostridioides difficile]MDB3597885.1 hypothetical protein [Clostridioides difficile]
MNKRIKMKKGLIHKKCDERCVNYDFVISNNLITCNVCIGCKYKENHYIREFKSECLSNNTLNAVIESSVRIGFGSK